MTIKRILTAATLSAALVASALSASLVESRAGSLSPAEAAAIAGVSGLIVGGLIADSRRHYAPRPVYDDYGWRAHVARCYARYRSYDEYSDTFLGYDGYRHRCRL